MAFNDVDKIGEAAEGEFQTLLATSVDKMMEDFAAGNPMQIQNEYLVESTRITTNAVVDGVDLGIGEGYLIASVEGVKEHYLTTPYEGGVLSQRLYRNSLQAQTAVVSTVNDHIKARTSWQSLAKDVNIPEIRTDQLPEYIAEVRDAFNKYGAGSQQLKTAVRKAERNIKRLSDVDGITRSNLRKAYSDVVKAAEKAEPALLEAKLADALQKKAVNNSEMLARTEISRAYFEGVQRRAIDDSDVVGWQSLLSSAHPRPDNCDFMAEADQYGKGAGIFPVAFGNPLGHHPRCICEARLVFEGEAPRGGTFNPRAGTEYLNSISEEKRKSMLGATHVNDTQNWRQHLHNWSEPRPLVATPSELVIPASQ